MKEKILSPHLSIYRFPLTVIFSILHRLTGIFSYTFVVTIIMVFNLYPVFVTNFFKTLIGNLFILVFAFSIILHTLTGIRHLVWDAGIGFNLKTVYFTNLIIIGFTIILTIFFSIVFLF